LEIQEDAEDEDTKVNNAKRLFETANKVLKEIVEKNK
jgi:hypothetical protein